MTMTGDFLLLLLLRLLLATDLLLRLQFLPHTSLDLTRTAPEPSPIRREVGAVGAAGVLLGGVLILCGVRLVRGGRRAGLLRVAHLHRVDDRRRRRVVRVRRADVLRRFSKE